MKKVLLAVDSSSGSRRAAEYLAPLLPALTECRVILFSVVSNLSEAELIDRQGSHEIHGDLDHTRELARQEAFQADICRYLTEQGFSRERLESRIRPQRRGVAQDIVDEAEAAGCDTIVVGRRDRNRLQELLPGSVSSAVVRLASRMAVLIVE